MGGYGSGRPGDRPLAEQSLALPIGVFRKGLTAMQQQAVDHIGWRETLRWRATASASALIVRTSQGLVVHLLYTCGGQAVNDPIAVVTTVPQFGGVRFWFSCPSCCKRVGVLYAPGGYWRCRVCTGVTYASSNKSDKRVRAVELALLQGRDGDLTRIQGATPGQLMLQLKALERVMARFRRF